MPIYSFRVDVDAPPRIVAERLRAVVGEPPSFGESFRMPWSPGDPASPPFIGTVRDESFRIRRDIRRRNSFLPLIWGRILATPLGTRVNVIMFIHPMVAIFIAFWFGMVGKFILADNSPLLVPLGMLLFGVVLTAWGFFPEAIKARRVITEAVLDSAFNMVQFQSTMDNF